MPTSATYMNGGNRSKLPVFQSSTSSSSPSNLKRANDELRQHISRLKAELDVEKAKSKQIHRDKVADVKRLKDEYDKEKLLVQGSVVDKMKNEHDLEMKRLRETLQREKEIEVKQILKFKDEELRTTKKMMAEDKEFSLREQDERFKRELSLKGKDNIGDAENKLRQELTECKKQKQQIEDVLKQKSSSEAEKIDLIRKLKEDHEKENQRIVRDARIQIARNVHELKNAQKALTEKEQELTKRELVLTRLEEQKEYLSEKLRNENQLENGSVRTDKERELQLKNVEMKRNLDEVTKKLSLLEKEALLKRVDSKDIEASPRTDYRVKELKKRNGELVNLAKKLEDKAKRLQEELRELKSKDTSSVKSAATETHSTAAIETFKKSFMMQRARDLAENAKALMAKDKEIVKLQEKITDLEGQLKQKAEDVSEIEKLEMVIQQIEKEKLKLEKQFADKMAEKGVSAEASREQENMLRDKLINVEAEKRELEKQIEKQKEMLEGLESMVERLQEKGDQYDNVLETLKERNEKLDALAKDLSSKEEECRELTILISDAEKSRKELENENEKQTLMVTNLQKKLSEMSQKLVVLENLENEYKVLQNRLSDAEKQCELMQGQVAAFQDKVKNYKKIEQDLRDSEDKCKIWERDYDFAVEQINKRNKEITELHEAQKETKDAYDEEIFSLQSEISRLEDICVDLESKENDYKMMLDQRQAIPNETPKSCNHVYVQTSRPHTPLVQADAKYLIEEPVPGIENIFVANTAAGEFEDFLSHENAKRDEDSLLESEQDISQKGDDDILDIASSRIAALAAMSSSDGEFSREDQPSFNRYSNDALLDTNQQDNVKEEPVHETNVKPADDIAKEPIAENGDTSDELSLSLDEMSDDDYDDEIILNNNKMPNEPVHKALEDAVGKDDPAVKKRLNFKEKHGSDSSVFGPITPQGSVDSVNGNSVQIIDSNEDVNRIDKLSVFIAKYTYDPFKHSPNEDPSLELALEAGDYVYVFGEADEDGFFTGELVNGQRGLVPSNFVQKIADETELLPISNGHDAYPGDESDEDLTEVTWTGSPEDSFSDRQNDTPLDAEYLKNTPRPSSAPSVSDIFRGETSGESEDEFFMRKSLSPPRKLKVERQLNNSIVLSWLPPEDISEDDIRGYSIKADGKLKETVIGSNRTKALVSDIHRDQVHRITVHCFDKNEKESPGSVAAITVGRGASAVPTDLRIHDLTPSTANLEWACGNSAMVHAVYLDGEEIHLVKSGLDHFQLTNLIPDHEYEVSVEARSSKEAHKRPKNGTTMSNGLIFRTPKGGPPEPPLNVQVTVARRSASHKQTSIDVSWLPVTIIETKAANSPIISGYKVYMNDNEAAYVDQPTVDHVKIPVSELSTVLDDSNVEYIEIWVKTQSMFGESIISNVVVLPLDDGLFKDIFNMMRKKAATVPAAKPRKEVNGTGFLQLSSKEQEDEAKDKGGFASKTVTQTKGEEDDGEQRVKNKPTVIRYDVVDSDDTEASDEDDSDDEVPHVFNATKSSDVTTNEKSENGKTNTSVQDSSKPSDSALLENLILPSIPMPDYPDSAQQDKTDSIEIPAPDYPDAIEVKARKHFPLEELLSTSDSELSAIEEETFEDLLEYNKNGSRSNSPQKTYSLSKTDSGKERLPQEATNKTYSLQSEKDPKKVTIDVEDNGKKSEKISEKKSSRTSKDTLTFSSDDVLDLLDRDIVGAVPDLPLDEEKECDKNRTKKGASHVECEDVVVRKEVNDVQVGNESRTTENFKSDVERRKTGGVPVTDLSDLSSNAGDDGNVKAVSANKLSDAASKDPVQAKSNTMKKDSLPVLPDAHDIDTSADLPAKQTPAPTKDQENIDARPARRKWSSNENIGEAEFAKGEVSLESGDSEHVSVNKIEDIGVETDSASKGHQRTLNVLEKGAEEGVIASVSETVVQRGGASKSEGTKGSSILDESNFTVEVSKTPHEVGNKQDGLILNEGVEISMGQAVGSEQRDDLDSDLSDYDDEPIKIKLTSIHDIYTLNTVDSFDDSALDSELEYKPYFTPIGIEENVDRKGGTEEHENGMTDHAEKVDESNIAVNSKRSVTKGPAMEETPINGVPIEKGIHSTAPAPYSQDNKPQDNAMNENDEDSNADTRTNHVVDETPANNVRVFVALFTYDPITMSPNTDGVDEELAFNEGDLIKVFGDCDEDGFYYGELHEKRGFVPSNMVQEVSLGDFGNSFNIPPPPSADISGDTDEHISEENIESRRKSQSHPSTAVEDKQDSSTSRGARKESSGLGEEKRPMKKEGTKMDDIFTRIENIDLEEKQPDYRYISERDSIYCLPPRRMIALYDYDPALSSPNVDSEVELPFNKGDILLIFGDMDEDGFFAAQSDGERGLVPSNFLEDCPEPSDSEEIEINMGAASPSIKNSSRKSSLASGSGASPVDSPKTKKKKGILAKGKKIFSKLKGK